MAFRDPPTQVRCPRCDYDQRGVMATWKTACPLDGVCSECGLHFTWAEVLNPRLSPPRWWVETRPPRLVTPGQIIVTLARSHWPWAFWSRVKMTDPIRPKRIAAYLLVLLLILYVGYAATIGIATARSFKIFHYNLAGTGAVPTGNTGATPRSNIVVGLRAGLLPLSDQPDGTYKLRGGRTADTPTPLGVNDIYWSDDLFTIGMVLMGQIVCGLAFAALPISRRRAKVRWRHIFRVTAYSLAFLFPVAFVVVIGQLLETTIYFYQWYRPFYLTGMVLAASAMLVTSTLFWWVTAARRYLRMEHHWAVGLSVVGIGIFAPLGLVSALYLMSWIDAPF